MRPAWQSMLRCHSDRPDLPTRLSTMPHAASAGWLYRVCTSCLQFSMGHLKRADGLTEGFAFSHPLQRRFISGSCDADCLRASQPVAVRACVKQSMPATTSPRVPLRVTSIDAAVTPVRAICPACVSPLPGLVKIAVARFLAKLSRFQGCRDVMSSCCTGCDNSCRTFVTWWDRYQRGGRKRTSRRPLREIHLHG